MKRARQTPVQLSAEEATQRVHSHFAARTAVKASLALFWCLKQMGIRAPRDVRQMLFRWMQRKQITIQHAEDVLQHQYHMYIEHLCIPLACDIFCENVSRGDFRVMSFTSRLVDELVEDRVAFGKSAFDCIYTPHASPLTLPFINSRHINHLICQFLAAEFFFTHYGPQSAIIDSYWRKESIYWQDFMLALDFIGFNWHNLPAMNIDHNNIITPNTRILGAMLENGATFKFSIQTTNMIALFRQLCGVGALKAAKIILRRGGFDASAERTALHVAAESGQWRVTRFLLKLKWLPSKGVTPLMLAVSARQYNVVELLLQNGVDVNYQTSSWTALYFAVHSCDLNIFRLLIKFGAVVSSGLLREAVFSCFYEIMRILIDEYDADVNDGSLHAACAYNKREAVELLLSRGADPDFPSERGTPRQIAMRRNHFRVCEIINSFTLAAPPAASAAPPARRS